MMLGGYLEFFMSPSLANTYLSLKRELNELVHKKVCICRHLCSCHLLFEFSIIAVSVVLLLSTV